MKRRELKRYFVYDIKILNKDLIKLICKDFLEPEAIILKKNKFNTILKKHGNKTNINNFIHVRNNLITLINKAYEESGIWTETIDERHANYIIELQVDSITIFTCILEYTQNDIHIINLTFYPNDKLSKSKKYDKKYGKRIF